MIQVQSTDSGNTLSIRVAGRFDFSTNVAFRGAYQGQERKGIKYRVDFGETDYMDSSALGMLLNLKQYADENGGKVVLCNLPAPIQQIIDIAQFHKIFTIEN